MEERFCIAFDLDGVICEETKPYRKAKPNYEVIDWIKTLKEEGYRVIIYTARRKKDEKITKEWLRKYKVKYDRIYFNKPKADIYIDDRAFTYEDNPLLFRRVRQHNSPRIFEA